MIYRSKAPFRIGLAGGGTDVSPYTDEFGGAILNATINLFAYSTIIPRDDDKIVIRSIDTGETLTYEASETLPIDGVLDLQKGVYNKIIKEYIKKPLSFELITSMDVPTGSGLGTSSTLVVSIVGAFTEWLQLPLGEYDMARLAFEIERNDLNMAGGRQDQYAATFGGVNFMEFYENDKVVVNPLRIKNETFNELQFNLLLFYTEISRSSSDIIVGQKSNVEQRNEDSIQAMHNVKEQAFHMKEAILKNDLDAIGEILNMSWKNKKQMAKGISTPYIDEIYDSAMKAGASGGKISGAGGGGFMIFYCSSTKRYEVINALKQYGKLQNYQFNQTGVSTWKV